MCVISAPLVVLLLLGAGAARRLDPDFDFDDDASPPGRRPRRYIYDPHNPLCASVSCSRARREVCVLRDARTALCANKKDILRRGDTLVAARPGGAGASGGADEDVFYDAGGVDLIEDRDATKQERCVGCGRRRGGNGNGGAESFLCGSDNRTYSSLCRLDLHNCVRRPRRPVTLACRGFCPCQPDKQQYDRTEWYGGGDESAPNEVWPSKRKSCALDKMADRLLDWFSVLMDDAGAQPPPTHGFPRECKPEVRWMFAHLDTDGDGLLSSRNLYALRHDEREQCLRPFLAQCGGAEGAAAGLTRAAWCGCMRRAARPCLALARAHPAANGGGAYVPACDARGFYRPRQCHAALAVCWCVTPHGQEVPGTRTKGAPTCPRTDAVDDPTEAAAPPDDDEDADDADDLDAGSGAGAAPQHDVRF